MLNIFIISYVFFTKQMYIDVISSTDHFETHATIKKRYKYDRLKSINLLTLSTLTHANPIVCKRNNLRSLYTNIIGT